MTAVAGALVRAGDPGFEEACLGRIFNARRPARRPAAVLAAADAADVCAGVRLARAEGWTVSVRSGGHSWAAWSLRDDALLIDLGRLRGVDYDAATQVAVVGPATRGGEELVPVLEAHDRVFPGGHCPSVGLGGFLLQGGQGWNSRKVGWACEHVVAVDVVTADGELLHCDEQENSDLLWAARGAGSGFPGVVVAFHLRTHPRPRHFVHDTWTFALQDAEALLTWMHAVLPALDTVVEPVIAATRLPDVPLHPGVARPEGTVLLLHTTAMCDTAEEAERVLAPLRDGPPAARALGHVTGPTSLAEENRAQAAQNPEGHRYAVDCQWTDAPAAELAPRLQRLWAQLPTEHSFAIWYGWAPTRTLPDMAFSLEAKVYLATYAIWTDAADDERHRAWVVEHTRGLAEVGVGTYLGDTDFTRRPDRFIAAGNFRRLEAIQAARDPEGRICRHLTAAGARLNAA